MKTYPSISGSSHAPIGQPCVAFYKYDGSNLRFEWSKKQGFNKFGTRTRLFDATDPIFGGAIQIFMDTMAKTIEERVLRAYGRNLEMFTVYAEFLGDGSFAGSHVELEPKYLKLFDINIYKKGMIDPVKFVELFGDLDFTAQEIYRGPLTVEFIEAVRNGVYPLNEGVIVKGGTGHKLWMVKIKTMTYLAKLKANLENWQSFWE